MLLQAAPAVGTDPVAAHGESYFSLMAKGGVILIPIFLLAGLAIFLIADKWHFLRKLDKSDNRALAYLLKSSGIIDDDVEEILDICCA